LELPNGCSPDDYAALGGRAIFRFGGAAKGMAEELTRPEDPRRYEGPVGFEPRENDLTLEQTPYVLIGFALMVDEVAMGEPQQSSIRTAVG